jgi:hypothetical protein
MPNTTPPTVASLLADARGRGWKPAAVHAALLLQGEKVSIQAVCAWYAGGGMRTNHRVAVAKVIGLPPETLLSATTGDDAERVSA